MSDLQHQSITLNLGPHYAATIGPLELKILTDGERVFSGLPEVGYSHRGIEKIAEKTTWNSFLPYTDRIDYLSAVHSNLAYVLAVESLAGIEVSERASYIRVVVSELNRISSHLLSIGWLSQIMGSSTPLMYVLREREKINNLFEMLCGARLTYSYLRIGGVSADVTDGFIEKTYEFIEYLVPKLREYNDLISSNIIFKDRLSNLGVISSMQAIDCGVTGPNLRATGTRFDVRKSNPYCSYHHFDFEVVIGSESWGVLGDAFQRYLVRLYEIGQSASLIKQALDRLPDGPSLVPQSRLAKIPKGQAYAAVESSRGLFGVYVASDGEKQPYRVHFRTPSMLVLNLFPKIITDVSFEDVYPIVASLDIMVSEVDR